jgi:predicted  nucleic acid-binding Zn-ribbon protein
MIFRPIIWQDKMICLKVLDGSLWQLSAKLIAKDVVLLKYFTENGTNPPPQRFIRLRKIEMSYIQSTIICDKCKYEINIATGTFGYGMPQECPRCGLKPFEYRIKSNFEWTAENEKK